MIHESLVQRMQVIQLQLPSLTVQLLRVLQMTKVIDVPSNVDLNGGEEIQVKATDNRGRDSVTVTTTATDVTAPDAPVVNGVSSDDTQVTGQAEPGSTVTVTFDGTTATGTTDDEGNYTIDIPTGVKLEGGEEITATATDNTGNVSDTGATNVTDTTAPDAPVVNGVSSDATQITGQAEPGSTVTVTFLMVQLLRVKLMKTVTIQLKYLRI